VAGIVTDLLDRLELWAGIVTDLLDRLELWAGA